MPEQSPGVAPDLGAQLNEIDASLRAIQSELDPERKPRSGTSAAERPQPQAPQPLEPRHPPQAPQPLEPRHPPQAPQPPALPAFPPGPPPSPPPGSLAALTEPQARLLSSMRELLEAYGLVLAQLREPFAARADAGSPAVGLAVSAGPFGTTDAVRAFEQTLAAVPAVLAVRLRGYEGENRAIFDVHLSGGSA